jgi:hypothetical protein
MDEENVVHTDNGILLALRRKSCDFDMGESIGHLVRQTRPRRTLTVLPLTLEGAFSFSILCWRKLSLTPGYY